MDRSHDVTFHLDSNHGERCKIGGDGVLFPITACLGAFAEFYTGINAHRVCGVPPGLLNETC